MNPPNSRQKAPLAALAIVTMAVLVAAGVWLVQPLFSTDETGLGDEDRAWLDLKVTAPTQLDRPPPTEDLTSRAPSPRREARRDSTRTTGTTRDLSSATKAERSTPHTSSGTVGKSDAPAPAVGVAPAESQFSGSTAAVIGERSRSGETGESSAPLFASVPTTPVPSDRDEFDQSSSTRSSSGSLGGGALLSLPAASVSSSDGSSPQAESGDPSASPATQQGEGEERDRSAPTNGVPPPQEPVDDPDTPDDDEEEPLVEDEGKEIEDPERDERVVLQVTVPNRGVDPGEQFYARLELRMDALVMSSYAVTLYFDPAIVNVTSVLEVPGGFGPPHAAASNELGFATISERGVEWRTGSVVIADVLFQVVGNSGDRMAIGGYASIIDMSTGRPDRIRHSILEVNRDIQVR